MKLGCLWLGVGLLACSAEKEVDPLGNSIGFCEEWAKRACSKVVVTQCGADDALDCRSSQSTFCESIVPNGLYSQAGAEECLDFVELAYKDGDLDAEERDAVRSLAAPCDMVLSGSGGKGARCHENSDCDRESGFDCLIPLGATAGTCQKPNKVGGGLPCDGDADVCTEGFYCDVSGDEQNCLARKNAGKPCSETIPCAGGLNCETQGDAGDSLCRAKLPKNELGCETDSDCATGICQSSNGRSICATFIQLDQLEEICEELR